MDSTSTIQSQLKPISQKLQLDSIYEEEISSENVKIKNLLETVEILKREMGIFSTNVDSELEKKAEREAKKLDLQKKIFMEYQKRKEEETFDNAEAIKTNEKLLQDLEKKREIFRKRFG